MNIYVGNLSFSTSTEELKELFSQFGKVESVRIIRDRQTGRSRGFGFVEMNKEDGILAIKALNGQEFGGRKMLVNEAKQQEPRPRFQSRESIRNEQENY